MDRRSFLRLSLAGSVGASAFGTDFWRAAYAAPALRGPGPYGPIEGREPDENGLLLPDGFTSRVLARAGEVVGASSYAWHVQPDGGAVFPTADGWCYVSNSEADSGGVGALRFDRAGEVVDAYRILDGSARNCSGGPTPWGTWLSCEEFDAIDSGGRAGQVWECDPTGEKEGRVLPALGRFSHEAVAVDPEGQALYLSEDQPDGRFYRFTPTRWPDLDDGVLEAAYVSTGGRVSWIEVPDPSASRETVRAQVGAASPFDGGEGLWYDQGDIYFTTKGDGFVRRYDISRERLDVVYDPRVLPDGPLKGVDNITASSAGDLYVATDGTDSQMVVISAEREVTPFLQLVDEESAELTGPAFSPDGRRLYFSSLRGGPDGGGLTYEVQGPFRVGERTDLPAIGETLKEVSGGGFDTGEMVALGTTTAVAGGLAAAVLRRHRNARSAHGSGFPPPAG